MAAVCGGPGASGRPGRGEVGKSGLKTITLWCGKAAEGWQEAGPALAAWEQFGISLCAILAWLPTNLRGPAGSILAWFLPTPPHPTQTSELSLPAACLLSPRAGTSVP